MSSANEYALKDQKILSHETPKKSQLRNYFELTRLHRFPIGNILSIWPCIWSLTMAAYAVHLPPKALFIETIVITIRTVILHAAACVLNDICDRNFDRQVERTKHRPLAAGVISVSGAVTLLMTMVSVSISMLPLNNQTAMLYGLIGVFPLHALYPLMKRWTYWPQAWLGLAMNWGMPVAWITVAGQQKQEVAWYFFLGTIAWTLEYDTIYACQDRKDDAKAGIKSTALLFGDAVRPIMALFAIIFLVCMTYAGYLNGQGLAFYAISCGGAAIHFIWQLTTWKVNVPADCGAKFNANGDLGYIIWAGMLADYYFRTLA